MKKIIYLILTILLLISLPTQVFAYDIILKNYNQRLGGNQTFFYLSTPNTSNAVYCSSWDRDLDDGDIYYITNLFSAYTINATELFGPTQMFNCHSFAWINRDYSTNSINMECTPDIYITDYSYCEVLSPQIGDIICYFDNNGTVSYEGDDYNVHSGVVVAVYSGISNGLCGISDLVKVVSKWSIGPLYEHNGYECIYTSYGSGSEFGVADYVKFYRRTGHVHSYTYTDNGDMETHHCHCNCSNESAYACNFDYDYPHTWNLTYIQPRGNYSTKSIPIYECLQCGAISYTPPSDY